MIKVRLSNNLVLECKQVGIIHGVNAPSGRVAVCFDGVLVRIKGIKGELKVPFYLCPDYEGDFNAKWLNKVLAESQYIEFEESSTALIKED